MMRRVGFILPVVFLFSLGSATAATMYKWVDENGQVHYSQVPPPTSGANGGQPVEKKTINRSTIAVQSIGEYDYCGELQLPGPRSDERRVLAGLSEQENSWRESVTWNERRIEEIIRTERQMQQARLANRYGDRYGTSNYSKRDERERLVRQIDQYHCALDWAAAKRRELLHVHGEVSADITKARGEYERLLEDAYNACGPNPEELGSGAGVYEKKRAWDRCMYPFDKSIREAKRRIETMETTYHRIK